MGFSEVFPSGDPVLVALGKFWLLTFLSFLVFQAVLPMRVPL